MCMNIEQGAPALNSYLVDHVFGGVLLHENEPISEMKLKNVDNVPLLQENPPTPKGNRI